VVESKGFEDMAKQWWDSYKLFDTPCYVLANKLKLLKLDLKHWNKEVFRNVEEMKKSLLEEIQVLDGLEEERLFVEKQRVRRAKAKVDLENVVLMQEISWWQKSRGTWIKEGNHNTRFFHRLANSYKRNNFISSLCIDASVTSDQEEIKDTITQYFKNLFTETTPWRPKLDGLTFPCLDSTKAEWLERRFKRRKFLKHCFVWMETKCWDLAASLLIFYFFVQFLLGFSAR
jgi:hypothetical protein